MANTIVVPKNLFWCLNKYNPTFNFLLRCPFEKYWLYPNLKWFSCVLTQDNPVDITWKKLNQSPDFTETLLNMFYKCNPS